MSERSRDISTNEISNAYFDIRNKILDNNKVPYLINLEMQ
jgi:hypothetical protein